MLETEASKIEVSNFFRAHITFDDYSTEMVGVRLFSGETLEGFKIFIKQLFSKIYRSPSFTELHFKSPCLYCFEERNIKSK